MAKTTTVRVGNVSYVVSTHFHVQLLADVHPAVATATADGKRVTDSEGRPLEIHASSEDEALELMQAWLKRRNEARQG